MSLKKSLGASQDVRTNSSMPTEDQHDVWVSATFTHPKGTGMRICSVVRTRLEEIG